MPPGTCVRRSPDRSGRPAGRRYPPPVSVRPLSVAFLGNDTWSVPSLEALTRSAHRVAAVLTFPPRPAGRGASLRPTRVAESARSLDLPLVEAESVRRGPGRRALAEAAPDVLVVVAY